MLHFCIQLELAELETTLTVTSCLRVITQCNCFVLFYYSLSIMALQPFALVRWVEDPKPSCWQVIKTTSITSDRDGIMEGKAVDANWKKGEETAVAEIIKLGGNKSYLTTVMENELIKPWRQSQLPSKRVSVPKRVPDFVSHTNEEPTTVSTMELPDSTQDKTTRKPQKRKSTDSSLSPKTTPKNQKKDKNNKAKKKSEAAKAYVSASESDSDEHEVGTLATISKVMAEKVLAKTMLQKQRTNPVSHKEAEVHNNTTKIDVPKVTLADESAREQNQDEEDVSSDSETNGKSISHSTSVTNKGCCKFCQKELSSLKETLMDTVSEVKNLKKQLKKLKRTSGNADQLPESEFSLLEKECRELVSNSTSVFNTVNILMRRLFTEQEIISHSVSGKASNTKTVAKPKFDTAKLELLKSLVLELHKEVTVSQITLKIQAVQKSVKKTINLASNV